MKTSIESFTVSAALYTIIFILIASIAFGVEININPPVDSNLIANNIVFEEEAYIDDIPFNTEKIVANYKMESALEINFDFEEEAYIDDIPFDTKAIAENVEKDETLLKEFDFEDETNVDDIPFNTKKIASEVFFQYYYSSK